MSSGKFKELKVYLQALPEALPLSSPISKLNKLLEFSLDEDWLADSEAKNSEMDTPADPVEHPLKWLDDGLTDLSGYGRQEFDLALQFDIRRYIDILADKVSDCERTSESKKPQTLLTKLKNTAADTLAPGDEEWGRWE
jgi:hypothetical protein